MTQNSNNFSNRKDTNVSLTLHCLAKQDQMDDGHMIMLSVINYEPIVNIIGEPLLDKIKASAYCDPTNHQRIVRSLTNVSKKKGHNEWISTEIFPYEHNLN
jgi:hypothetical protein